jgi:hypothetical protein
VILAAGRDNANRAFIAFAGSRVLFSDPGSEGVLRGFDPAGLVSAADMVALITEKIPRLRPGSIFISIP